MALLDILTPEGDGGMLTIPQGSFVGPSKDITDNKAELELKSGSASFEISNIF